MKNGFEINISEADFKARPLPEQNWILFQGVTTISKCVSTIDDNGCEFGRKKYRGYWLKILSAITGGITVALGVVYIVYRIVCQ